MKSCLANRWIRIGLVLVLFGWMPLIGIVVLAGLGLWPDPNPNPVGPGILFFFTAWPAIICLGIGVAGAPRRHPLSAGAACIGRSPVFTSTRNSAGLPNPGAAMTGTCVTSRPGPAVPGW